MSLVDVQCYTALHMQCAVDKITAACPHPAHQTFYDNALYKPTYLRTYVGTLRYVTYPHTYIHTDCILL